MSEIERLDEVLASSIDDETRAGIWESVRAILEQGPAEGTSTQSTVLALGYVQSGKTTSITALAAAAADAGYQVIVALLGSTNLLLDQNRERLEASLGITTRSDYVWISETNPATRDGRQEAPKVRRHGTGVPCPRAEARWAYPGCRQADGEDPRRPARPDHRRRGGPGVSEHEQGRREQHLRGHPGTAEDRS